MKFFNPAFIATLILALSLAADTFSVGIAVGAKWCNPRQVFRLSFHFGFFQALMPVIGWGLGELTAKSLGIAAQYVAAVVVGILGGRMLYSAFKPKPSIDENPACEAETESRDPTRGSSLILLSLATSTDALGAGFSLALLGMGLLAPCLIIGCTAMFSTMAAMILGRRIRLAIGRRAETGGGLVLIGLAIWIVYQGLSPI